MIITDGSNNNSNGNEREGVHKDFCGEYAPAFIQAANHLSGKMEVIVVRANCVRQCSRYCEICDCCKFKCGHTVGSAAYEDEEDEDEEDFGLGDEVFDAGKN